MEQVHYDVIVVGAGPAGVTAAATVARGGASVLLLEAGVFAGAENWSGCVYFCESLAAEDAFGADAVAAAPWERRVVRRGIGMTNGQDLVGLSHEHPETFEHCYTVLRPAFDPYWAEQAQALGATYVPGTTVTSLIRRQGRVVGVHTNKGAAYADVTFLAEGDASHLTRFSGLEQTDTPGFTQGVKAVFKLSTEQIEQRFGLAPGEGAATDLMVRNARLGGRTLHLNMAAFIYTNRDTLSVGYVAPLEHLASDFTGDHDTLLSYVTDLPGIAEYLDGATLAGFGAKLIRTGGVRRAPILVEDGLAVGGATAAKGIDLPCPNFTGPAAATGLYFGRAALALVGKDQAPTTAQLTEQYLEPLNASRYGQDADYLADWPGYLESTRVAFGVGIDLACGGMHYLSERRPVWQRWWRYGRFLRDHLRPKVLGGLWADWGRLNRALGVTRMIRTGNPFTLVARWFGNHFKGAPKSPGTTSWMLRVDGQPVTPKQLPFTARRLLHGMAPLLGGVISAAYTNNDTPIKERLQPALTSAVRNMRFGTLACGALVDCLSVTLALISGIVDLFRFKILKVSAAEMLAHPVAQDANRLAASRDLGSHKTAYPMAERLAKNTYVEGDTSHIRLIWPEALASHSDVASAPYWSVCPAGVYAFESALSGHGSPTINFENCIKCESCWQSDGDAVQWGRHTDHQLIYRPDTPAWDRPPVVTPDGGPNAPRFIPLPHLTASTDSAPALSAAQAQLEATHNALTAFELAVDNLPFASDNTRLDWPVKAGRAAARQIDGLAALLGQPALQQAALHSDGPLPPLTTLAETLVEEAAALRTQLDRQHPFEALVAARRTRDTGLTAAAGALDLTMPVNRPTEATTDPLLASPTEVELRDLFTDTRVKMWDRTGVDEDGVIALTEAFATLPCPGKSEPLPAETLDGIRAWAAIHPALALVGLHTVASRGTDDSAPTGAFADGRDLTVTSTSKGIKITGTTVLLPSLLTDRCWIAHGKKLVPVALAAEGVSCRTVPAGGLHPAHFNTIEFNLTVDKTTAIARPGWLDDFMAHGYAAIGLGAGDYLARRAVEQAASRIQFPGQMTDPAGRDSIAKFGAVKALVARTVAWRDLLAVVLSASAEVSNDLLTGLAGMAFSPRNGRMGYDAGQVFGGTGYSEDDLLSRFYRDSAVFPHLAPGTGALPRLAAAHEAQETPLVRRCLTAHPQLASLQDGPLSATFTRWHGLTCRVGELASVTIDATQQAVALSTGLAHWLDQISQQLGNGLPVEGPTARVEVLLTELANLIDQADEESSRNATPSLAHFPELPDRPQEPLALSYDALIHLDEPYASGDFLRYAPGHYEQFIPEIQIHDPQLRARWSECYDWFLEHCDKAPDDGGPYERYMERLHTIPPEMMEAFTGNGFLASVVPTELDGLGWKKVDYYLLVSGAMRFGDASLSLLIMANTSIGTTPALISLDKEIPLVQKELGAFTSNKAGFAAVQDGLAAIVAMLDQPNPAVLERAFTKLMGQVETSIRKTRVVKYLAQHFLTTFYTAALAGKAKDFGGFADGLREAQQLLNGLEQSVADALAELPRRQRAAEAFLRRLGNGGAAAFALTEPTAGSDSGGVATVGHLKQVKLTPLDDGRLRFEIDGEERFLLDADRIQYIDRQMSYRLPDDTLCPVSHAGYDYATDEGLRTILVDGKALPFHDVGQVRDGNLYRFYEVSGAKMWITNGRVATQFSMYIKTDEGITGLMVDRHAEGLIVGRDEDKMGQQGSPTNELSIDRVRVPRENIIGYEGHGQVNALETLNVGRCGLAVAGVVMARRTLVEAQQMLPPSELRDHVLGEISARIFTSESLVYHLIGRFDNHATESVRLESAAAKFICSEVLHEALDKVETLWGGPGQTQDLLLEKMRRDARILNIYEGTNEVQRFLILRELCALVADWPDAVINESEADDDRGQLAHWKNTLKGLVTEAVEALGDVVWQDAAMQTAFFPLSEMAGELYLLDTSLVRLEWLENHRQQLGDDYVIPMMATGRRGVAQCFERLGRMMARYQEMRPATLNNRYPVDVVAADTTMEIGRKRSPRLTPLNRRKVLTCLIRPVAVPAPTPRIAADGSLSEPVWQINPSDEHALATALAIADAAQVQVTVRVVSAGHHGARLLQQALAAGADEILCLELPEAATPAEWGAALTGHSILKGCDGILVGDYSDGGDAPLGAFMSGTLGQPLVAGSSVTVDDKGHQLLLDGTTLPERAVVVIDATNQRLRSTLTGVARCGSRSIPTLPCGDNIAQVTYGIASGTSTCPLQANDVTSAAAMIRQFAEAARKSAAPTYDGSISRKAMPAGDAVWAVVQSHEQCNALFGAARSLADRTSLSAYAVVIGDQDGCRQLAGTARQCGLQAAFMVDSKGAALSHQGKTALLAALHDHVETGVHLLASADWSEALGQTAGEQIPAAVVVNQVCQFDVEDQVVQVSRLAHEGRLLVQQTLSKGAPLWATVSAIADFGDSATSESFVLSRAKLCPLTEPLLDPNFQPPAPDLRTAEVIVDIGFGAGSEAGLALARSLVESLEAHHLTPYLGATRKVTQGLGLLPVTQQIGQTGVAVNPRLLIALGISGAPQHVDYLGARAQVLALNKDPDAPIMGLHGNGLTVHGIVGDLFETVPALIAALEAPPKDTSKDGQTPQDDGSRSVG